MIAYRKIKKQELKTQKRDGYVYFLDKEHPLANVVGRVWYHRHLASIKQQRWLKTNEHVHHINGDVSDNNHTNLVILTRAEHALTHCFLRGHSSHPLLKRKCKACGNVYSTKTISQKCCSYKCSGIWSRRLVIEKDKLERLIWEKPTSVLAKELNVSDTAIAKRCKKLGIKKPPRGYWAKERAKK